MADKVAELIAAECPKCGAAAKLEADRDRGFCQYCGTQVVLAQAKVVHQHFGGSGGTPEAHLKMAQTAIAGQNYEAAIGYLDGILRMKPDDADAWLMKGEACQRLVVLRTQLRTRPIRNAKGHVVGTETYTEEVPTYPRAEEGKAAFRHGVELLEAEMQGATDPTPQLQRLVVATARLNGNAEVEAYLVRFCEQRPEILYPHEVVIGHRLQRGELLGVAQATRRALRLAEGAPESPTVQRGKEAVETKLAQLAALAAAAREKAADLQAHQYVSLALLAAGLVLLFFEPSLGLLGLLAGALYYYFAVSKRKTAARDAQAAHDHLAAAWTGA